MKGFTDEQQKYYEKKYKWKSMTSEEWIKYYDWIDSLSITIINENEKIQ